MRGSKRRRNGMIERERVSLLLSYCCERCWCWCQSFKLSGLIHFFHSYKMRYIKGIIMRGSIANFFSIKIILLLINTYSSLFFLYFLVATMNWRKMSVNTKHLPSFESLRRFTRNLITHDWIHCGKEEKWLFTISVLRF